MSKHWTQTVEGKKRLKRMVKRSWKVRRMGVKKATKEIPSVSQESTAYCFGHCEAFIQAHAERTNTPFQSLAAEVGKLLQYGEGGKVRRS